MTSRGLREVCHEFRLGLSPTGAKLSKGAGEKGFTREELGAAGLLSRRGGDYFERRLMFPLTDARSRIVGFQARKLHENDPLRGKYVNSPESELFRKSNVLYGLNLARPAISKEDRALVVEGNTDVIALRQAGSPGGRLDGHRADRGAAEGARAPHETPLPLLRLRCRRRGRDAARDGASCEAELRCSRRRSPVWQGSRGRSDRFEQHLGAAESYPVHRVRLILDRTPDRQLAYLAVQEFLNGIPESPERHDAWRLANDRLGLTVQLRATGGSAGVGAPVSSKMIDADERLERRVLAGCVAHPDLVRLLAELTPEHFDSDRNRRLRAHLVEESEGDDREFVELIAELDAVAAAEAIDEQTAKELLLRLRERHLRRELADADPERAKELQDQLIRIRSAVSELV